MNRALERASTTNDVRSAPHVSTSSKNPQSECWKSYPWTTWRLLDGAASAPIPTVKGIYRLR